MVIRLCIMPSSFLKYFLLYGNAKNKKCKSEIAQFSQNFPPSFLLTFSSGGIPPPQIPPFLLSSGGTLSIVLIFSIFLARYLLFSDLNFPLNTKDYESNILTTTPFRLCSGRMRQRFRRWRFETLELRSSSIIQRASWGNTRV